VGPADASKQDNAPADAVWEGAMSAPLETENADERRAVEAAKQAGAAPIPAAQVTERLAERLRNAR
jgi:hypothetical protein